jgi:hypothetical protein
MQQRVCDETDFAANSQFRQLRSRIRHLQERINDSERSVTRIQRMTDEMIDGWDQADGPSPGSQTTKTVTRVVWRRGQGTTVERFVTND